MFRFVINHVRNEWSAFVPKTNIMWMHYLTDKLLRKFSDKRIKGDNSDEHFLYLKRMQQLRYRILDYNSCQEFVFSDFCAKLMSPLVPRKEVKRKRTKKSEVIRSKGIKMHKIITSLCSKECE